MKPLFLKRISRVLLAVTLAATGVANAASSTWSGPSTGSTTSPNNGTWDTTSLNWNGDGSAGYQAYVTGTAVFGGTGTGTVTVTLGSAISATNLQFIGSQPYLITGTQTITVSTSGTTPTNGAIELASGATATIDSGTTISFSGTGNTRLEIGGTASGGAGTLNVSGALISGAGANFGFNVDGGATVNILTGGSVSVLSTNSFADIDINRLSTTDATTINVDGGSMTTANLVRLGEAGGTSSSTLIIGASGVGGTVTAGGLSFLPVGSHATGSVALDTSGTLTVGTFAGPASAGNTGNFYFNGGTLIASGALTVAKGAGALNLYVGGNSSTANSGVVVNNSGNTVTISAALIPGNGNGLSTNAAGTTDGGVTSFGSGTLLLSGANTYTGATTVTSGTLQAGIATVTVGSTPTSGAFGVNSAVSVASGATLDMNGFNENIGSLSDSGGSGGTVTNTSVTSVNLLSGGNNSSTSYSGTITGSLALNKVGTGTQTLSGANTYTGGTTVSFGSLVVNNTTGSGTGTGAVQVASGATLGGNGIIATSAVSSGNAVDIAAGAILSPSNGVTTGFSHLTLNVQSGTSVTLEAGSKLAFNLGASNDEVSVTGGTLSLNGQDFSDFTFNVEGTASGTYTLIDSANGFSGTGLGTSLTGTFDNGLYTGTLFISGNDIDLSIASVPEPGTWAMMLGGFALLVLVQRRAAKRSQI